VLVDPLDQAVLVVELVDRLLQLLVEDPAVGEDDDRVVGFLVVRIVQGGEPVGEPDDSSWRWTKRCRV